MANRWVEFVKEYAKKNNISYTCAMCEIKTKGLYKPLDKKNSKKEQKENEASSYLKQRLEEARKQRERERIEKEREKKERENMEEEDFNIPTPIKAPKNIEKTVDKIEEEVKELDKIGREVGAVYYNGRKKLLDFAYLAVMNKYKGECIPTYIDPNNQEVIPYLSINSNEKLTNQAQLPLIGQAIRDCIDRNIQVICIYLTLEFGTKPTGHANILIYRPFERIIERFEPHGQKTSVSLKQETSINKQLKLIFEVYLTAFIGTGNRYYPPFEICPFVKGFQSLEGDIKGLEIEGGGFCAMWSLFILEMVLNNPTKSTKEIIEKVMEISTQQPEYLKNVIRGYVVGIQKIMNDILTMIVGESFLFEEFDILDKKRPKNTLYQEDFDNKKMLIQEKYKKMKLKPENEKMYKFYTDIMLRNKEDIREKVDYKDTPAEIDESKNPFVNLYNKLLSLKLTKDKAYYLLEKVNGRKIKLKGATIDDIYTYMIDKYSIEEIDKAIKELYGK